MNEALSDCCTAIMTHQVKTLRGYVVTAVNTAE